MEIIERRKLIQEAIEQTETLAETIRQLTWDSEFEYLRRTFLPELEGKEGGWMGNNFGTDQLKKAIEAY